MRVVFLFTQNRGVISNFFMEISSRLVKDGHDVFVFCLKKNSGRQVKEGVQIIINKKGGFLHNYGEIFRFIKLNKPDVVISNFTYVSPSLIAGTLLGIKKNIVWSHTMKDQIPPRFLKNFIKKNLYRLADKMVVNSMQLGDERFTLDGVERSRIFEIPYWSNFKNLESSPVPLNCEDNVFFIGCPGRITVDKNQLVLVNAIAKFKHEFSGKIQVFFAGEGPHKEALKAKVIELKLDKEIQFIGLLSSEEMVDFYKKMHLIVLPSLFESFGLVLIETLSLGRPVLVSKKFGALEYLTKGRENLDVITFDPEDPKELGSKLLKFEKGNELNNSFYENLYNQNFDKEIIYNKFLRVLER